MKAELLFVLIFLSVVVALFVGDWSCPVSPNFPESAGPSWPVVRPIPAGTQVIVVPKDAEIRETEDGILILRPRRGGEDG